MPNRPHLGHQPVLDGIRGVAVIAVCGFNFHWSILRGGFFGVDIFFVLSGFLITTLLMEERSESGAISLRTFFLRRILRLIPALVCMMTAVLAFTFLFQDHGKAVQNAWMALASLFFVSNWLGVWDGHSAKLVLGHTWSLAVEGQFYLLWSLVVAGLATVFCRPLGKLTGVAFGIVCGVFAWRLVLWHDGSDWERLYLGTDTRLDGVFIGALAALIRHRGDWRREVGKPMVQWAERLTMALMLGIAGLILLALAMSSIEGAFPYAGGFSAVSVAVAVVILHCLQNPFSWLARALSNAVLTWFGRISYSLYLWHLPVGSLLRVERLARLGIPEFMTPVVQVSVSLILSAASFLLIERPVLRWGRGKIEALTKS